jgi:hypothetical protein
VKRFKRTVKRFDYVEPTAADIDAILRRSEQRDAAEKAIAGDPSRVAAILRAEGFHIFADLFEQAKLPRRMQLPGAYPEVKADVLRIVRDQPRYHGPFANGERVKFLDWLLTTMSDQGDLAELSRDELARLRRVVLKALIRGPDKRPLR